jgi:hypothetical protein
MQPQDAAFSPDGTRIAVIGAFTPCTQLTQGLARCGHGLAIYNSAAGAIVQMSPIEPLIGVTTPDVSELRTHGTDGYVAVRGLGWSPDSVWFAMAYTVFNTPSPTLPDSMQDSGLLLLNPQTGATQIIRGDTGYFDSLDGATTAHPVWHITRGNQTAGYTTAPGVIFAWGADGLPFPTVGEKNALSELPANAGARYPVGQPDGSAPFTIWQPGLVIGPGSAGVGGGRPRLQRPRCLESEPDLVARWRQAAGHGCPRQHADDLVDQQIAGAEVVMLVGGGDGLRLGLLALWMLDLRQDEPGGHDAENGARQ